MNLYQHMFLLTIMLSCAIGWCWSTYKNGKPADPVLIAVTTIIAFGYVFTGILNFFLWLGTF